MTRNLMLLCISFLFSPGQTKAGVHLEDSCRMNQHIEHLLEQMTLEEKIGQMNQLHCENMERLKSEVKKGRVGSVMSITDPEVFNEVQRIAVEESRLGIPLINARDVIHGFKTIFPIPLGQAASFNPDIVEKGARIAAQEASAAGIRWTFAPMIDITHDPRWGRIAEGFGEDPLLVSRLGQAAVRGFQGEDLRDATSIAACIKHFAGYGAAEGGRDYNSTYISERRFRDLYLRPFQAAVKEGAATLMTAFNDNDGIPSAANPFLLKEVLREEWKFDGTVVSDWASIAEMVQHGFCEDGQEAALKAVKAGTDIEMVSETYIQYLPSLVEKGEVTMETIDNAVRNILRLKFRLGIFGHPYRLPQEKEPAFYRPESLKAAQEAAGQSAVLLKNERQTLPLPTNVRTLLITGPMADAPYEQLGTWVFDGEASHTQTPLQALRERYEPSVKIIYEPALSHSRDTLRTGIGRAEAAACTADYIIAFVGEESILSGEAHCLADLHLQGAQTELIRRLAATGKPLVTIVMAGRPLCIEKEAAWSDALLYAFHPGTMGGPALARLLSGEANPSGKLPVTFPRSVGQIPLYYNHTNTGRPAGGSELCMDDIPVGATQTALGNKSYYLDAGSAPLYPFGYGLSYTTFAYEDLSVSKSTYSPKDTLTVTANVTNTGSRSGTEVVQLYFRDVAASVTRPVRELIAFDRVHLEAGEKKQICFKIPIAQLSFRDEQMRPAIPDGLCRLWIGGCSQGGLETAVTLLPHAERND